jgi:hypothetical protein
MIGMNNYLNTYVDRRMKSIVEEWDLSTRTDISDLTTRLGAIEQEIPLIKISRQATSAKLAELENRAKKLKEKL